jgi:ribosomal protein S18 acetylase RimI-like enzyme
MIRDVRRSDTPRLFDLMEREFPEESRLLGNRPEGFEQVVRRVFRWDSRLVLGLMRAVGRPVFRFLVVEEDGHLIGTTLVTFPRISAYVSNVVVDPAFRRRGYAKQMLEEARATARRTHRQYLALEVLDSNTGARALYESIGYRPLRAMHFFVLDATAPLAADPGANPAIRSFRRPDARALAELARRQTPPAVESVLPTSERAFVGSGLTNRILLSEEASWVVDRGRGPEGHIAATVSAATEAAHVTAPVLSETVDPALGRALVQKAGAWCAVRRAPRILCQVAEHNQMGRAALEAVGFRNAFSSQTLYRTVD